MRFLLGFLRNIWHGLDVFRRVLHLLLLVLIFGVIVMALGGSAPPVHGGALLIQPQGEIVEQLAGEPLQRALSQAQGDKAPETLLWDLTDAIRAAAKDERIKALLIDTDHMTGAGQVKLEELAAAIREFKATKKRVIAHGSSFEQGQYYLAAQADEIYLDPFGTLYFKGYGRYPEYLKGALDKLAVNVHLFRAGKYKSAAEPYVREDMSAEDREETLTYLNALWAGYRSSIAAAIGKKPDDITAYIDGLADNAQKAGGDLAMVAKSAGLVTDLKTSQQLATRMVELVGADPDADDPLAFNRVELDAYIRSVHISSRLNRHTGNRVGVIVASGEILDGDQPSGTIGGESTAALVRKARLDSDIKAVVLRVDSPGGSVIASEEIYRELQALKAAGKPLVVSMGDLAASGGYYISALADEIIASPNTITGSIGVYGVIPTFEKSINRIGVTVDGVGTTDYSGLSLIRPLPPAVSALIQGGVNHSYQEFLTRVASGRGKSRDAIDAIAQGRVWAGSDALKLGLIDRTGNYQDAVAAAAKRANLGTSYSEKRVEPSLSLTEQLLFRFNGGEARLMRAAGIGMDPALLQLLSPLSLEVQRLQRFALRHQPVAYCFCGVE
jgi:protease-4